MRTNTRLLNAFTVLMPILISIILILDPSYSTGTRALLVLATLGFCWQCQLLAHDWEYLKDHEKWDSWAGPIVNSLLTARSKVIGTGLVLGGREVIVDTSILKPSHKYLGRWTYFVDPVSKTKIWRDNLKSRWYIMR